MDANFESYDKIFDSIKKKVYDNLIKEKSRTHDDENTSDESGTDDDLDWEFQVLVYSSRKGKCECSSRRIIGISDRLTIG